jgi:hypothetical protein
MDVDGILTARGFLVGMAGKKFTRDDGIGGAGNP